MQSIRSRFPVRPGSDRGSDFRRRRGLIGSSLLVWLLLPAQVYAQCAEAPNPIVCENALPGTTDWRLSGPISSDTGAQIQGFASATSVDTGSSIDLLVTVAGGGAWNLEIYRMGWYDGDGGRLLHSATGLIGVAQGACTNPPDVNQSHVCNWSVAAGGYTLAVPTSWTTGLYLAKLETTSTGHQAYIPFVVREDDRDAVYYYEQAVMNYQAYNRYPSGPGIPASDSVSFYSGGSGGRPWERTLSFKRPYSSQLFPRNNESPFGAAGDGSGGFFTWDFPMIQWLEREGYDVSYATNIDLHTTPARVLDFSAMLSVGHDEYWSEEMAVAASAARDAGVDLAFFAGNHVFGTVAYDPVARTMTGLTKAGTPGTGTPSDNDWWDAPDYPDKRKRQALLGQANTGCCARRPVTYANVPWIVAAEDHWVFAGTGFQNGDDVPYLLGYEPDAYDPSFDGVCSQDFTLLSASPFDPIAAGAATNSDTSWLNPWPLEFAHSTIYAAPRGAWVFSAGSTDWPWGLATPFAASPEFEAARDSGSPADQGFALVGANGVNGLLVTDAEQPAWQVDASADQTSLWNRASLHAEGSESQTAYQGTTVRTELRVLSGDWITFYHASSNRRFTPRLFLDTSVSPNILRVDLLADDGTAQSGLPLASGSAATAWHTHEIVHDPVAGSARYVFDGIPIGLPWTGQSTTNAGLYFGQGSTPVAGAARFRTIEHVPTNPLTPDARIQTLTRNVLDAMAPPAALDRAIFYDSLACDAPSTAPADSTGTPSRMGWTPSLSLAGTGALTTDSIDGEIFPVWLADGSAGRASWNWNPSAALEAHVAANGWRIESRLRVLDGDYLTDYYADGSRRFMPILRRDPNGDLAVTLESGGDHVLATGSDADDYHSHVVLFNPLTQNATYYFDGTAIETWSGSTTLQRQITFGQGSTAIAGRAHYRSMTFQPAPEPGLGVALAAGLFALGWLARSGRGRDSSQDPHESRSPQRMGCEWLALAKSHIASRIALLLRSERCSDLRLRFTSHPMRCGARSRSADPASARFDPTRFDSQAQRPTPPQRTARSPSSTQASDRRGTLGAQ